jgi:type I restriction enzyme R subunit
MPKPGEYKTVQSRILAYAEAIHFRQGYGGQVGWKVVLREEAEQRRGLNRKERREHKEGFDWSIWPQAAAKFAVRKFSRRLRENRLLASEHFCHSLLQNSYIV